jgi:voltage-gated potassium channel
MNPPAPKGVRRRFLVALGRGLYVTWPVLSTILVIELALGLLIGFVEGWSLGDAVYFSFVTGLTIGYGDIVPRQALTRALAIGIGLGGILLTGLVAAIAVNAMRATLTDGGRG